VTQFVDQHLWINRATLSLCHRADGNHPKNALLAHEALFEKRPLAAPTDQARVNLEGLKYFEVMTKLSDRTADYRERLVLSEDSQ